MRSLSYQQRRGQIEAYFDRTAADAWARLTSDAPVSRIRETVRAGRDQMRGLLLSWLPEDLRGRRILDAGCGTGAFAVQAALRGADVLAIDLSAKLVDHARERAPRILQTGSLEFRVGDMTDGSLGHFDHVVAMDSLIHYRAADSVALVCELAERTTRSILFTFAPRTPLLATMHAVGRVFPRGDRAPAIEPVGANAISRRIATEARLREWRGSRTRRVTSGFYMSQAMEVARV